MRLWITHRLFELADYLSYQLTTLGFKISPEAGEPSDIPDLIHNINPTNTPFSRSIGGDK